MPGHPYINSGTGEFKFQGTTGAAVLSEDNGDVNLIPINIVYSIVSSISIADTENYTSIGTIIFNPASIFDGNSEVTRLIYFKAIIESTTGVTGRIRLYNITLGSVVDDTVLLQIGAGVQELSVALVVGDNIPNSSNMYDVQLQIATPANPSPGDYTFCSNASIVVSYA